MPELMAQPRDTVLTAIGTITDMTIITATEVRVRSAIRVTVLQPVTKSEADAVITHAQESGLGRRGEQERGAGHEGDAIHDKDASTTGTTSGRIGLNYGLTEMAEHVVDHGVSG